MRRIMGWMVLALVGMVMVAGPAFAGKDPVKVGPNIYHVVLDNDKVRVSEIHFAPGDQIPMHTHPDHVLYVLSPGTLKLSYPDGKEHTMEATQGQIVWVPAETHAGENIGTTDFRALVVELKPLPTYDE